MKTARWIMAAICLMAFAMLGGAVFANDETNELSATLEKPVSGKIDLSKLEFMEKKSSPDIFETENAEQDLKVYKDSAKVKYHFKENKKHGNVLCGIQKERYYATYVPGGEIITEKNARQIAEDYLKEYIENFNEYTFNKLTYNECDAVFVISYYLPVQGFVSADQIMIYITWDGEVGAFSAFNRYDFEGAPVLDKNKLEQNQASVMKKETAAFAARNGADSASYTVDHSILTIRNGQYYLDQYVTITDSQGQEVGTVIPVPIT